MAKESSNGRKQPKQPKRTRRITTTTEEQVRDREAIEAEGREIPVEELEPDVDKVLQQLGEEAAKVYLERRGRRDRRWSMVDTIYADEFSLENVKANFGGGEYRARIIDRDGNYLKARNFYIEGPERYPEAPGADVGRPGEDPAVVVLLKEVLTELRQPQRAGVVEGRDPLDTSIKMVEVIMSAIAPLLAMRDSAKADDPWGVFDRALDLGERLGVLQGGKGEGNSMVTQLAGEVLGVLRDSRKPGAPGTPAAGQPPAEIPADAPMWVRNFAPFIPMVQQLAQQGRQPDLYAAVIVDRLDGSAQAFLADQLAGRGEQFVDEFYRFFPATAPFREWYDAMFAALVDILVGPPEQIPPIGESDERNPKPSEPPIPGADAGGDS